MGELIPLEHIRVELGEEFGVQGLDRAGEVGFGHHEAEVEQGSPLRNHANIDAFHRVEDAAGDAGRVANVVAHQADDGLAGFDVHFGEFPEFGADGVELSGVVDGE